MCGSATFAMDVSSTSMNVASVTVMAITQGLIVPSGIRSFARILFRIALETPALTVSTYYRCNPYLYSALIRNHRRVHVHPRPQNRLLRRNGVQHDLHGNPLHHFHVIPRRVFRRQQAQHRTRRPRDRIHMPAERLPIRIHLHFGLLSGLHIPQLRLFEICRHPHVVQWHNHQQPLPRLHDLSRLHLLVRRNSVHRRRNFRVAQIQLRRVQRRSRLLHFRECPLRIRGSHAHLPDVRSRRTHSRVCLFHFRLCRISLRFGHFYVPPRLLQFCLIRFQCARARIRVGFRRVILLFRYLALLHQWRVTRQVRFGQLRIRLALLHVCLRPRQIRRLCLLVSRLRPRQVRLCSLQLRIGARISARHVLPRPRHVHSRRPRFAFRQRQRRLRLVQCRLVIARINLHQHLSCFHRLVVLHQNLRHAPVHFRSHWRDVPIHLRIVRRLPVVVVQKQAHHCRDQHDSTQNQSPFHLRIGKSRRSRRLQLQFFRDLWRLRRVF